MARVDAPHWACDRCGKKLPDTSAVELIISLSEDNYWQRLHVRLVHRSGINNDARERAADLCQNCTCKLLSYALHRAQQGERQTAGWTEVQQKGWN